MFSDFWIIHSSEFQTISEKIEQYLILYWVHRTVIYSVEGQNIQTMRFILKLLLKN